MATHSSIAWRIPWTEEPEGWSPQGHRDCSDLAHTVGVRFLYLILFPVFSPLCFFIFWCTFLWFNQTYPIFSPLVTRSKYILFCYSTLVLLLYVDVGTKCIIYLYCAFLLEKLFLEIATYIHLFIAFLALLLPFILILCILNTTIQYLIFLWSILIILTLTQLPVQLLFILSEFLLLQIASCSSSFCPYNVSLLS